MAVVTRGFVITKGFPTLFTGFNDQTWEFSTIPKHEKLEMFHCISQRGETDVCAMINRRINTLLWL